MLFKEKTAESNPKVFKLEGFLSTKLELPFVILLLKKLSEGLNGASKSTKLLEEFSICNLSPDKSRSPSKAPIIKSELTGPFGTV